MLNAITKLVGTMKKVREKELKRTNHLNVLKSQNITHVVDEPTEIANRLLKITKDLRDDLDNKPPVKVQIVTEVTTTKVTVFDVLMIMLVTIATVLALLITLLVGDFTIKTFQHDKVILDSLDIGE